MYTLPHTQILASPTVGSQVHQEKLLFRCLLKSPLQFAVNDTNVFLFVCGQEDGWFLLSVYVWGTYSNVHADIQSLHIHVCVCGDVAPGLL